MTKTTTTTTTIGCGADAPIIFAEAHLQGRPTFYARWLASIFLYLYRQHVAQSWLAVMVFPDRSTDTGIITPYEGLIGCGLLRRVDLSDLLGAEHLGLNARLARLVLSRSRISTFGCGSTD